MANSRSSGRYYEYAKVDTAPANGSGGYFTNPVYPRKKKITKLFFSIRETTDDSTASVVVVKLQFKCPGDTGWTNHMTGVEGDKNWPIGTRVSLNEWGEGVEWRAGVEDGNDFTSGAVTFGFDW
jgi:hypothetical protein